MTIKTNYHSHTTWCDGKDTPYKMAQAALEKGFTIFGIACHSFFPFSDEWHIPVKNHIDFLKEVNALKQKFSSSLKILCGFETDFVQGMCTPDIQYYKQKNFEILPDYIIGSVHYIQGNNGMFTVDGDYDEFLNGVKNHFKGNAKKAVQEYFALERMMLKNCHFDFLGHPDLIKKLNDKLHFFDEGESWYKKEIKTLAKEIAKSGVCVEVNTGAMSRGYTKTPYPSPYFLKELYDLNVPVTYASDTHSAQTVDYWYDEALQYIKNAGYRELAYLKDGQYAFYNI